MHLFQCPQATRGLGYWTRNMNQECYGGTHAAVYVPIGIVAIGLFCLAPPAAFFAVTFSNRKRLDDLDVTAKYGFLYAEYRCGTARHRAWLSIMQVHAPRVRVRSLVASTRMQAAHPSILLSL